MGDWSAMVKQLPTVTMRYGIRRNERALQTHEFDLVPSCYFPFPFASQQSSGCSWAGVSGRGWIGLFYLSHPWMACAAYVPPSLTSVSPAKCPEYFLSISVPAPCLPSFEKVYLLFKPCLFSHLLPLTIPFPHSLSSYLLNSGFLQELGGNVFISFWFSSYPITSHLILASFSLPLTCLSPLIPLLPCIS